MISSTNNNKNIQTIAFNAFKGGTGKTTTVFNIGYYLARRGIKVLLVDADPQCNLTQVFLKENKLEEIYNHEPYNDVFVTIGESLLEVIQSRKITPPLVTTLSHHLEPNLSILPGSMDITEYESSLAAAIEAKSGAYVNIPGAFYHLVQLTAHEISADVILIDTSPSLGKLNMMIVMFSTYFVLPCQADFFSYHAVKTFQSKIADWKSQRTTILNYLLEKRAIMQLSSTPPKLLGACIQMFAIHNNKPAEAYQHFIMKIRKTVKELCLYLYKDYDMSYNEDDYISRNIEIPFILGEIRNFNRFAPMSQSANVPVLALLDHPYLITNQGRKMSGLFKESSLKNIRSMTSPFKVIGQTFSKFLGLNLNIIEDDMITVDKGVNEEVVIEIDDNPEIIQSENLKTKKTDIQLPIAIDVEIDNDIYTYNYNSIGNDKFVNNIEVDDDETVCSHALPRSL